MARVRSAKAAPPILALAVLSVAATALPVVLSTSIASAELTQRGNLFVRFDGGISPTSLPRGAPAPIAIRIEGKVRVLGGERPPSLRRLKIAINRGGKLNTRGLPLCRRGQISNVGIAGALRACGRSLVGTGGTTARTTFEDQRNGTVRGTLLFFATKFKGRDAILGYIFQGAPAPATDVMLFRLRRAKRGPFGTVISARVPDSLAKNAYLTNIFMRLQRTYVFRGKRRAYLSAACAAPRGFPVATFPFARASATFDDGRTLSSTMVRSCRVRGGGGARSSAEPDNSPAEAGGPLVAGRPYEGAIESRNDTDYYAFYVTSPRASRVTFDVTNLGGGSSASFLGATITDSASKPLGAAQFIDKGKTQSVDLTLAPGKYYAELAATQGFDDEGEGDAYRLIANGQIGAYEQIAGRCAAASKRLSATSRAMRRLDTRRQRSVARLRLARFGSPRSRRKARRSHHRLLARISRARKARQAAARSRQPWCSIPR